MINFSDIKEDIISVHFDTRQELEYFVDNLRKLGYVYGTGKMDNDVRNVLDNYGKLESSYLTLDRTRDYIESNWVSIGKHKNAISYDFKDIEWEKGLEKSDLIMENIWNVVLYEKSNDGLLRINPEDNPKQSGEYLCTCVQYWAGLEVERYLQIMSYDAEKNCWYDRKHKGSLSHTILAWTDKVEVCNFKDFEYAGSGALIKK